MFRKKLVAYGSALAVLLTMVCGNINSAKADDVPKHIGIDGIFAPSAGSDSTVLPGGIVQITPDKGNQKGSIWSLDNFKLDLNKDFESLMYINLGSSSSTAGDGMAFVLMNDPISAKTFGQTSGGSIGVWRNSDSTAPDDAIKNSFAVEFDTFNNEGDLDGLDAPEGPGRKSALGHIANGFPGKSDTYKMISGKTQYGMVHHNIQFPHKIGDPTDPVKLSNGTWHPFRFKWDSEKQIFTYQFDDLPEIAVPIDPASTFGSSNIYWGFTGSTGGNHELNQVVFSEVPGLNSMDSPVTITNKKTGKELVTYKNGEVNEVLPVYAGSTVHYKIVPTENENSIRDITNLLSTIKLGNITYQPGTLMLDGVQQDETGWATTHKQLDSKKLGELLKSSPTKTLEFDATVDSIKAGTKVKAADSFTYNADLLAGKQFNLNYTISPDTLVLDAKSAEISLMPSELNKLQSMTDSKAVIQELAKKAGLTVVKASTDAAVDVSKVVTDKDALTAIKTLKADSTITLNFSATDSGMTSNKLPIKITAEKEGTLHFGNVATEATFKATQLTTTAIAMHDQGWDASVVDGRDTSNSWQVSLALTKPFENTDGSHKLLANLKYLKADNSAITITDKPTVIETGNNQNDATTSITDQWTDKTGLALTDISNGNYPGDYSGELTWSLSDVPAS